MSFMKWLGAHAVVVWALTTGSAWALPPPVEEPIYWDALPVDFAGETTYGTPIDLTIGELPLGIEFVTFTSSDDGVCAVADRDGWKMVPQSSGSCDIRILVRDQSDQRYYNVKTVTVGKATQTIDFTGPSDRTFSADPLTLSAISSAEYDVTFQSRTAEVCEVTGVSLTMLDAGTCTVEASNAGDDRYTAASVVRSFVIGPAEQTVSVAQPSGSRYTVPDGPLTVSASATSGTPVEVSVAEGSLSVCELDSDGRLVLKTIGTCVIDASVAAGKGYSAASTTKTITVIKATQTISFPKPANRAFSVGSFALEAAASSLLRVTFTSDTPDVCTVDGSDATTVDAGTCTIVASQDGSDTVEAATSVTRSFTIAKATGTLSTRAPSTIAYGESANLVVSFAVSGVFAPPGYVIFSEGDTVLDRVDFVTPPPPTLSSVSAPMGIPLSTTATLPLDRLAAGTHTISIRYPGSSSIRSATAEDVVVIVTPAATSTVVSTPAATVWGERISVTGTVSTTAPGSGTPTGTAEFLVDDAVVGTGRFFAGTLNGTITTAVDPGTHTLKLRYVGSTNFATSTSAGVSFTVGKARSKVTLVVNGTRTFQPRTPRSVTATVTALSPGKGTPGGQIVFRDDAEFMETATLFQGSATVYFQLGTSGTHTITADYYGSDEAEISTASVDVVVDPTVGRPTAVAASETRDQTDTGLVALAGGGQAAVWRATLDSASSIFVRRYLAGGSAAAPAARVDLPASRGDDNPAIAATPSGGFVIVWDSLGVRGTNRVILMRRYGSDGAPLSEPVRVDATDDRNASNPKVAVLADGSFAVVWQTVKTSGGPSSIMARRFGPTGIAAEEDASIVAAVSVPRSKPVIAALGGAYVVAYRAGSDPAGQIVGRLLPASGAAGPQVRLDDAGAGNANDPALAGGTDTAVLAFAAKGGSGENRTVYVRLLQVETVGGVDGLKLVASSTEVNPGGMGDSGNPALAAMPNGSLVVAWTVTSDGERSVIYTRLSPLAMRLDFLQAIQSPRALSFEAPAVAAPSNGSFSIGFSAGVRTTPDLELVRNVYIQRFGIWVSPCDGFRRRC